MTSTITFEWGSSDDHQATDRLLSIEVVEEDTGIRTLVQDLEADSPLWSKHSAVVRVPSNVARRFLMCAGDLFLNSKIDIVSSTPPCIPHV